VCRILSPLAELAAQSPSILSPAINPKREACQSASGIRLDWWRIPVIPVDLTAGACGECTDSLESSKLKVARRTTGMVFIDDRCRPATEYSGT
jgi:hypothetical protein